ncbi:hypothetical protein GJ698_18890 [Pseudoduganella sp. FT26W]|uniref:Uncharacterized protein n=1 Tax=Duganella aquatilis TaxID=2666082 RepID=A0A844DB83_9BURK|nr:hypothetical protein [Duganella aquatilis]MRW86142.1 hypothetical protein [Duganella aquatilis]
MKTSEAERLAKIILESTIARESANQALPSQASLKKTNEERLRQARRQFDKKYSLATPPEFMKI